MYTQLSTHVGSKIKDLRLAAGLSQEIVADYLGISPKQLSEIEAERQQLTVSMITELSDLFCCPNAAIVYDDAGDPSVGISYRLDNLTVDDLKALARFNRIVLNQIEMVKLLDQNKNTNLADPFNP